MIVCIGPKTKQNTVVEEEIVDDEVIVDDSDDLEELAVELQESSLDEECNEALGDVFSDLINSGYDIDNLFDPSWK